MRLHARRVVAHARLVPEILRIEAGADQVIEVEQQVLVEGCHQTLGPAIGVQQAPLLPVRISPDEEPAGSEGGTCPSQEIDDPRGIEVDRKSTRLNSSHANISYAVFCLKKKKLK